MTNNRCERGEIVGDPKDAAVRAQVMEAGKQRRATENLFDLRQKLLFQDYPNARGVSRRETVIGLAKSFVLLGVSSFWTTFWRSLGFQVQLSDLSTRAMYENGLEAVTSDTVCLSGKAGSRPYPKPGFTQGGAHFHAFHYTTPSENPVASSNSMCAVVKGYPLWWKTPTHLRKNGEFHTMRPCFTGTA